LAAAADLGKKILQNFFSVNSMNYLRVKLQTPDSAHKICRRSYDIAGEREDRKALWKSLHTVTMAHPNLRTFGNSVKKGTGLKYVHDGLAEFSLIASDYFATHFFDNQLKTIADSEHRNA